MSLALMLFARAEISEQPKVGKIPTKKSDHRIEPKEAEKHAIVRPSQSGR